MGDIDLGATKEPALHVESPVSEGTQDSEDDGAGEDTDGEGEESEDMEHELPIPLSMKACRAPILLNFNHPVSTNTIPAGLFKGLANGGSGSGNDNNASAAKENKEPMCHLIAHTRSSSTYLAHPSTTYASPPSHKMHHGAALSRTPVGGIPPPCYRSSLSQAHDCCASLSVMAPCVWGLSSRRQRT